MKTAYRPHAFAPRLRHLFRNNNSARRVAQSAAAAATIRRLVAVEQLDPRLMLSAGAIPDSLPGGGEPGTIPADRYELNDDFASASNLGTTDHSSLGNLTFDDDIHGGADVDYFKFVAPANGGEAAWVDAGIGSGSHRVILTVYNSAMQSLGTATTPATGSPRAYVNFNTTAGQTYYLVATPYNFISNGYSLGFAAAGASFSWSMAKHFGDQLDPYGLPIVPNTHDYVHPNPAFYFGQGYDSTYTAHFNGSAVVGAPSVSYEWKISGGPFGANVLDYTNASTAIDVQLPQGTYSVQFIATGSNGASFSQTQSVTIRDYLIVAMGDSFGAGEGNPNNPAQYGFLGINTAPAVWMQGGDATQTEFNRRAHRSGYAGVVQAAMWLENSDPHSSVTLVFEDQSGAQIDLGILQPWSHKNQDGVYESEPSQLAEVEQLVGSRHIDSLVMSIGGNDAGMIDMLAGLVAATPGDANYQATVDGLFNTFSSHVAGLAAKYDSLATSIHNLLNVDASNVLLMEYPDPTTNYIGLTQPILTDILDGKSVDVAEINRAKNDALVPMATAIATAAAHHGWTYVTGVFNAFYTHGYGDFPESYFRTATESAINQGPCGNNVIGPQYWDKENTQGTCHPNIAGQGVYESKILDAWTKPNLVATNLDLTAHAFLPGATDGYSVTVKNTSFLVPIQASNVTLLLKHSLSDPSFGQALTTLAVPALGPGETVTLAGVLPSNAVFTPVNDNVYYVVAYPDLANSLVEFNEHDNAFAGSPFYNVAPVALDRDLDFGAGPHLPAVTPGLQFGDTASAAIGDELIGNQDIDLFQVTVTNDKLNQPMAFTVNAPAGSNLTPALQLSTNPYLAYDPISGPYVACGRLAGSTPGTPAGTPAMAGHSAYLTYTFTQAGVYYIAVSAAANGTDLSKVWYPLTRAADSTGAYTLSFRQAPAVTVGNVINAIAGSANTITIKRDSTNNAWDQVWINTPTTGAPTMYADPTQTITINGSGGARTDTLVLDSSNGSPLGARLSLNGSFNCASMMIAATQVVALPNYTTAGGGIHVLNVASLTISGAGAKLDLGNNDMLVATSPANVRAMLANGQIVTTTTGGALGYKPAVGGGGQTEVRFTIMGDTDLDGRVNVVDLANLAGNFGKTSGQTGLSGDFDYNGNVNVADLADLAGNFGKTLSTSASATATPSAAVTADPTAGLPGAIPPTSQFALSTSPVFADNVIAKCFADVERELRRAVTDSLVVTRTSGPCEQ
jgi:hypothetical protein